MERHSFDVGMIGLGVMGRSFVRNMAERGFPTAGYDRESERVKELSSDGKDLPVAGAQSLRDLVRLLKKPRTVMLLVPAGNAVDAVLKDLIPLLEPGDLVVDGGNSFFRDTDLRGKALAKHGLHYVGMGISGGEHGARFGPSLMPGGSGEGRLRLSPVLEAVAAKADDGAPCVAWLGPGASGHYVKMVHNGIEYGFMELIAESYALLKRGLGLEPGDLAEVYADWNRTELESYLVGITARIFNFPDPETGRPLVDRILDEAGQKGTGMWTSQDAMDLGVPVPTIDAAVLARELSDLKQERVAASEALDGPDEAIDADPEEFSGTLRNALHCSLIVTFAQGFAQLRAASEAYGYSLRLEDIARIWRGGCIIRARLLESILAAFRADPELPNLLMDPGLGKEAVRRSTDLRSVVMRALRSGIPVPAFAASLSYFDGYRSAWLPANLIQAQRDYFGAHTYDRIDEKGVFHTDWERP